MCWWLKYPIMMHSLYSLPLLVLYFCVIFFVYAETSVANLIVTIAFLVTILHRTGSISFTILFSSF